MSIKKELNLFDYLHWRGDLTFEKEPINVLDMTIFSQLSIILFDELFKENDSYQLNTLSKLYFQSNTTKKRLGLIIPDDILKLLKEIKNYNRYKDLNVCDYVNIISKEDEEQMSALTFVYGDMLMVAYSGTDDTIIGWKENFNLIYKCPTKAQISATKYLEEVCEKHNINNVYICGHSKGGNLALYAAINAKDEVQDKIRKVYNFDGPGLTEEESKKLTEAKTFKKIRSILPSSSCVGRLFEHSEEIRVVKSFYKGFFQHDAFSWVVKVNDFEYEEKLSQDSIKFNSKVNEILATLNMQEREALANNIYKVFSYADVEDLSSFKEKKFKVMDAYFHLSKEEKKSIYEPFRKLLKDKYTRKILFDSIKENINDSMKKGERK